MRWRSRDGRTALYAAAVLMLTAFGANASARATAWIHDVPQDARYLFGVGVSTKEDAKEARSEAVAMGMASIAAAIYSAVSETYDETTDESRTALRDQVSLRTAHALEGAETVRTARVGGSVYALVRYPRAEVPAARLRYAQSLRDADHRARGLMTGGRLPELIQAVNLLEPYGGQRYEEAKAALFAVILDLKLEASRAGGVLIVRPAYLPVRLGGKRFTGKLNLDAADRLRHTISVDTEPFVDMIQNRALAGKVAEALAQKRATFDADCVSVEGSLARHLSALLPALDICVSTSSTIRLSGEYSASRDEAYSLPLTNLTYTISLSEGGTVRKAHQGAMTVVGDEKRGVQSLIQQIRPMLAEWFAGE